MTGKLNCYDKKFQKLKVTIKYQSFIVLVASWKWKDTYTVIKTFLMTNDKQLSKIVKIEI